MKRRIIIRAVGLWLAACPGLCAQPPDDDDLESIPRTEVIGRPDPFPLAPLGEDTLVTPDRSETFAGEVGSSVTVLSEEDIARTEQTLALETLRQVPGLDVVQQGGPGKLTSVFMRGAESRHTKVLLDGIPINDPSGASRAFDFSILSTDNIERIEVLRGPQSVLYGTDAIGGVINIITKRGDGPPTVRASAMGGSFGTSHESVNVSGGNASHYYSFGGSYYDTSGFSTGDVALGNFEADGYQNGTLSGRFGWTPADAFNVDYVFRYINANTEIDDLNFFGGPPVVDNLIRRNKTESFFQRVQVQSLFLEGGVEQKIGFSLTDYDRFDSDAGFLDPDFDGQTRLVDWQLNLLLTEANVLTGGIDYEQEEFSSTSNPLVTANNAGFYVQDRLQFNQRASATAGVRWTDHSSAGSATTYRVTALYNHTETATTLHGSIGTGFRAPSLFELFDPFSGNPNLRPEKSQGWDIGVQQQLCNGWVVFDATYFDNDFTDLITFGPPPAFALVNIGRARASGVEVTSTFRATCDTFVTANYTFTDTRDLDSGSRLARRPLHKVNFGIHHALPEDRGLADLYFVYVDQRLNSPFAPDELDSYILVNLAGSYRLTEKWELFGRVDNLLDEDYQEVLNFGTAGIAAYGGIRYVR